MSVHPPQTKPAHREIELDFIRGIAILMVLDFHEVKPILLAPFAWMGIKNFGWAGVDIFFVLSGFLVGGLLVKEWRLRGRIDGKRFLIRRGFKIWPQYYLFLMVMLLSGHRGMSKLWGNFLNIQNYVGGVAHTWTLAVEEHAYLLLVVALAIAARKRAKMRHLFVGIGATAALVLVWRMVLTAHGVNTFTRTDTRVDGILYGLMLAILYHSRPDIFRRLQGWVWLWLAILAGALLYFRLEPAVWWRAPVEWFCADAMGVALLMLLYRHREDRRRPVAYRIVAWIGLYSYGIYLWHVSVIAVCISVGHRLPGVLSVVWTVLVPPAAGIALGALTTKLVEFPALALRDKLFPRRVDSAVGMPAEIEKKMGIETAPESVFGG